MTYLYRFYFGTLLLALLPSLALAADQVALVIGNSAYQHTAVLANPRNDAEDVARALSGLGFKVTTVLDANKARMDSALASFADLAAGSQQAVVFFAGHGVEVRGRNYLVPVDARLSTETRAPLEAVPLSSVMDIVGQASELGQVVLDACRDNPLANTLQRSDGQRSGSRGLARVEPVGNVLVSYAAREGQLAADGRGRNSPFTTAFLDAVKDPERDIRLFWGTVRDSVVSATANQQVPFTYGSLGGRHYSWRPRSGQEAATNIAAPNPELLAFQAAQRAGSESSWQAFLRSYPNSAYAATANIELAALTRPEPTAAPKVPRPTAAPQTASTIETASGSFRDCPDCPEMVKIPGRNYSMGKYEVTFEEWDACVAARGCSKRPYDAGWGRSRRPVINVSWNDAQQYVKWLSGKTGQGYRLPTEEEWEHATRAGTTTDYWWGNDIGRNDANCDGCGSQWDNRQTAPVGSFAANPWGLHDVHGNVWEWTDSCWEGDCARRVVRGGSWTSPPAFLRAAFRLWYTATAANDFRGFRLARTD